MYWPTRFTKTTTIWRRAIQIFSLLGGRQEEVLSDDGLELNKKMAAEGKYGKTVIPYHGCLILLFAGAN